MINSRSLVINAIINLFSSFFFTKPSLHTTHHRSWDSIEKEWGVEQGETFDKVKGNGDIQEREWGMYKKRYIVEQVIGKVKNAYGTLEGVPKRNGKLSGAYWVKFPFYYYFSSRNFRIGSL